MDVLEFSKPVLNVLDHTSTITSATQQPKRYTIYTNSMLNVSNVNPSQPSSTMLQANRFKFTDLDFGRYLMIKWLPDPPLLVTACSQI